MPDSGAADASSTSDSSIPAADSGAVDSSSPSHDSGAPGLDACHRDCAGRQCGADGCGGSCGACTGADTCDPSGQCVCSPSCGSKQCGPDGCGGSCGSCPSGDSCYVGTCVAGCTPSCGTSVCGSNGCDGVCGICNQDQTCSGGKCAACTDACPTLKPISATSTTCEAASPTEYCCTQAACIRTTLFDSYCSALSLPPNGYSCHLGATPAAGCVLYPSGSQAPGYCCP